jgi:small-conductance mechanosensitive channel
VGHFGSTSWRPAFLIALGVTVAVLVAVLLIARKSRDDPRDAEAWRAYARRQVGYVTPLIATLLSTAIAFPKHPFLMVQLLVIFLILCVLALAAFPILDLRSKLTANKAARAKEQEEKDAAEADAFAREQRVERERRASAHSDAVWVAMRAELDDVVANWPTARGDDPDPQKAE